MLEIIDIGIEDAVALRWGGKITEARVVNIFRNEGICAAEGGAVTLNSANAMLDMTDKINDLLKNKKF